MGAICYFWTLGGTDERFPPSLTKSRKRVENMTEEKEFCKIRTNCVCGSLSKEHHRRRGFY